MDDEPSIKVTLDVTTDKLISITLINPDNIDNFTASYIPIGQTEPIELTGNEVRQCVYPFFKFSN